jgi:hypothetical protein
VFAAARDPVAHCSSLTSRVPAAVNGARWSGAETW